MQHPTSAVVAPSVSLAPGILPSQWEVVEFNPAHVAEQRKVNGKRGVKTDVVDAAAMFDLLVAGRGSPAASKEAAIIELAAWSRYRRGRVALRQDVEHHLVSLLDGSGALRQAVLNCDRDKPAMSVIVAEGIAVGRIGRWLWQQLVDFLYPSLDPPTPWQHPSAPKTMLPHHKQVCSHPGRVPP